MEMSAHRGDKVFQLFAENRVVIIAPGVTRNPSAHLLGRGRASGGFGRSGIGGVVVDCADDDALRFRKYLGDIRAARVVHIPHITGITAIQPFLKMFRIGESLDRCNSAKVEAKLVCFGDKPLSFGGGVHGSILPQCSRLRKGGSRSVRRRALHFWLLVPLTATMLPDGRLATNSGAHPQSEGGQRDRSKTCRALRTNPRCHGCVRTGALAGESRGACGSGTLVHGRSGAIPALAMEEQGGSSAGPAAISCDGKRGAATAVGGSRGNCRTRRCCVCSGASFRVRCRRIRVRR